MRSLGNGGPPHGRVFPNGSGERTQAANQGFCVRKTRNSPCPVCHSGSVRKVLVAGSSGSGKTTMARALGRLYGLRHYELDALHHGPGWVKRPEFEADVERFSSGDLWVAEDQYHRFIGE